MACGSLLYATRPSIVRVRGHGSVLMALFLSSRDLNGLLGDVKPVVMTDVRELGDTVGTLPPVAPGRPRRVHSDGAAPGLGAVALARTLRIVPAVSGAQVVHLQFELRC